MKMVRIACILFAASSLVQGFLSPSGLPCRRITGTPVNSDSTGWDSFRDMKLMTNVPSGEEQRKYRRTVYSHDDWKKHRSQDRFIYYLLAIFKSGVYKNLGREVWTTTSIAIFVVLFNAVVGGYEDFEGVKQAALISSPFFPTLTLPMTAFTLTSPSLGLLLGTYRLRASPQSIQMNGRCGSLISIVDIRSVSYEYFLSALGRGP